MNGASESFAILRAISVLPQPKRNNNLNSESEAATFFTLSTESEDTIFTCRYDQVIVSTPVIFITCGTYHKNVLGNDLHNITKISMAKDRS